VKLIWSRSNTILSFLIRHGMGTDCSHFALVFDDFLVIHSDLRGVHLTSYERFLASKNTRVMHEIRMDLSGEVEEDLYRSMIALDGKPYDFGAGLYWMWRCFLYRFFSRRFPQRNPLAGDGFLCTEMVMALPRWVLGLSDEEKGRIAIMTPHEVWEMVRARVVTRHLNAKYTWTEGEKNDQNKTNL